MSSSTEAGGAHCSRYIYKPLDAGKDQFRLLKLFRKPNSEGEAIAEATVTGSWTDIAADDLECQFLEFSFGEGQEYTVLSYLKRNAPRRGQLLVQNEIIHIDIELCAALTRLRSCTEDLVFWIADVCIDQSNPQERSQQVTRIGDIYRNARELFIWLGWERSTEAFSLLADFYEHREDHDWLKYKIRDRKYFRSLLRFGDLLRHGYWFRIWAIQEVVRSRTIQVHRGRDQVSWEVFITIYNILSQDLLHCLPANFAQGPNSFKTMLACGPSLLRIPQELGNSPQDLLKLLLYHSNRSATDPRDKIYALLGLLCEPPNLKVDYCSSVAQVYTDVARCIMGSSGKLDVLTAIERRSSAFRNHKRQQTRPHNLPTWVPDWSYPHPSDFYVKPVSTDFFEQYAPQSFSFSAAGDSDAIFPRGCDRNNESVLFVLGGHVATVAYLSEGNFRRYGEYSQDLAGLDAFRTWWALWSHISGTELAVREAFVRTILLNRLPQSLLEQRTESQLLELVLGLLATASMENAPYTECEIDSVLRGAAELVKVEFGYTEVGWCRNQLCDAWLLDVAKRLVQRNFFVSEDGVPGMGPREMRRGDKICILPGCRVPVILREAPGHWEYIGCCYLDGFMEGEGMIGLRMEEFKLH